MAEEMTTTSEAQAPLLSSTNPEPPDGSVVLDGHVRHWHRDDGAAAEQTSDGAQWRPEVRWFGDDDCASWTKLAGNYGPVRLIATPDTASLRRAAAAADPFRWRVGGSPGTHGRTLYQGAELVALVIDPARAEGMVEVLNEAQFGPDQTAAPSNIRTTCCGGPAEHPHIVGCASYRPDVKP